MMNVKRYRLSQEAMIKLDSRELDGSKEGCRVGGVVASGVLHRRGGLAMQSTQSLEQGVATKENSSFGEGIRGPLIETVMEVQYFSSDEQKVLNQVMPCLIRPHDVSGLDDRSSAMSYPR